MFSMERAWQDMLAMARAHREGLVAIAGIFAFLPSLAFSLFMPRLEIAQNASREAIAAAYNAYFGDWWPAFAALILLGLFGGLAHLSLALSDRPVEVRQALAKAARLLPTAVAFWLLTVLAAFAASFVIALIFGVIAVAASGGAALGAMAMTLAILPAIYLIGRTVIGHALIVAKDERNPLQAFTASIALTKRRGWTIAAMFVTLFILYLIILLSVTWVIGIVVTLIAPSAAPFLQALIGAFFAAAMNIVVFLLSGAVYRQLSSTSR